MVVDERKELVVGIEVFIVLAVAALDLAVVSWREDFDELVTNA